MADCWYGRAPNHVWAVEFQFDETTDRGRLKLCNVVDEFPREATLMDFARDRLPKTWPPSSNASLQSAWSLARGGSPTR